MKDKEYLIHTSLPESLDKTNMREVAETIDEAMLKLNALDEVICLYPRIDELSSDLIDALAIQFHCEFYDTTLPLETRRQIVKNTIPWHIKKGTLSAVEETVSTIFSTNASVKEWFDYNGEPYYFRVYLKKYLPKADELEKMKRLIRQMKNVRSWLETVIFQPGRLFYLNRSGPIIKTVIPDKVVTEKKPYSVFLYGLNAAGSVETLTHKETTSTRHTAYTFPSGTTNGRLRLNKSGGYSMDERDVGHDVIRQWPVFTGSRLNGKAPLRLNNGPTARKSRVEHIADWQNVINRHGNALNSGGGTRRNWTTASTTTRTEMRFKHPIYALNQAGILSKSWQDVGKDVEIHETVFLGGCLNGGKSFTKTETKTEQTSKKDVVFTASRLNDKERIILNEAASKQQVKMSTATHTRNYVIFTGVTLNGRLRLNDCRPKRITRTVHIPVWREVHKRHGGALLNAARHETRYQTITKIIPGKVEKKFDPSKGTLLNNHAVMGYMRLT